MANSNILKYLFIGCGLIVVALIVIGILSLSKMLKERYIARQRETARNKCIEYANLACSFKAQNVARIAGGTTVTRGMLPHQAYVRLPRQNFDILTPKQCSGTLVNEKFILTTAHCVRNTDHSNARVLLGSLNKEEPNSSLWRNIKKIHIHPDYTGQAVVADLSLLELEQEVEFTSDVRPICLNTRLEKNYNSTFVSGWGKTESGDFSQYLNMAELQMNQKANQDCRSYWGENYEEFDEIGICLAHYTRSVDDGDSGGPLQVKLNSTCDNTWEQIGVASMVTQENKDKEQALTKQFFVKVEYYVPWIVKKVWPH